MLLPSPIPKRHHLCCRYRGRPGDKHRAHCTPWRRPRPLPGPAMALPGHQGQDLGLSPGFAGWQRVRAGSVLQSGCHWGVKTGIKTAVPGEGEHRVPPLHPGTDPRRAPDLFLPAPGALWGDPRSPRCPGCGRSAGCPGPAPHPGHGGDPLPPAPRQPRGCSAAPRRRPRSRRHGRDRSGIPGTGRSPARRRWGFPPSPLPARFTTSAMNNPPLRSP